VTRTAATAAVFYFGEMSNNLMKNYSRIPISFLKGEGSWLQTLSGEKYLDALSGIAVCGLGHCHPMITKSMQDQAAQLVHTSNLYEIDLQNKLSEKLCQIADMDGVFFCNSGAEANEAAIKLTRLFAYKKNIMDPKIIVMENSFHGRTIATLSATDNKKYQHGFSPLINDFIFVPYNNVQAIEEVLLKQNNVVAIFLEPVQGEGGICIPDKKYLNNIRGICDNHDILMILDEVQSGMGRTGSWFCYQHNKITPDIITIAKSLGNGYPIGACLANGVASELFSPGSHGSTFGGSALACATALSVIETIETEKLCKNAHVYGEKITHGLEKILSGIDGVISVRGKGLMIGIELDRPCHGIVDMALQDKLLINVTADNVVRLLPPLIIKDNEAELIIKIVGNIVKKFLNS